MTEHTPLSDTGVARIRDAFLRAHPNSPDDNLSILHAALTVCNQASLDSATTGVPGLYPEQTAFVRTVLTELTRPGELMEEIDAAGNPRFRVQMENKVERFNHFGNMLTVKLGLGHSPSSVDNAVLGKGGKFRRLPLYEQLTSLRDLQHLIGAHRAEDGSVHIPRDAYLPYLHGQGVASWIQHLNHLYADTIDAPITLSRDGAIDITAPSADHIRAWAPQIEQFRTVDVARDFHALLFGYGKEVALTQGVPAVREVLLGVNGVVAQPAKGHVTEFRAAGKTAAQIRDALAALCPNLAERPATGDEFVLPHALADKVCKQFHSVTKALTSKGPDAALEKIASIRKEFARKPTPDTVVTAPIRQKQAAPAPVVASMMPQESRAFPSGDDIETVFAPLATKLGPLFLLDERLRVKDGTDTIYRPTEDRYELRFSKSGDAEIAHARLTPFVGNTGRRITREGRNYYLEIPGTTVRTLQRKSDALRDRLTGIATTYATAPDEALATRDALLAEYAHLLDNGRFSDGAIAPRGSDAIALG